MESTFLGPSEVPATLQSDVTLENIKTTATDPKTLTKAPKVDEAVLSQPSFSANFWNGFKPVFYRDVSTNDNVMKDNQSDRSDSDEEQQIDDVSDTWKVQIREKDSFFLNTRLCIGL